MATTFKRRPFVHLCKFYETRNCMTPTTLYRTNKRKLYDSELIINSTSLRLSNDNGGSKVVKGIISISKPDLARDLAFKPALCNLFLIC